MSASPFILAFLMGLTGSLHCAGMCGPIMFVMPFQLFRGARKAAALTLYHFSRISVYMAMAVILHSFRGLFQPRVQQYISIALGASLLLAGIAYFLPAGSRRTIELPWSGFVKRKLGNVLSQPSLRTIALAGMLNGMLPCGLVYMALSASVLLPSVAVVAGSVFAFGLGTMPMLLALVLVRDKVAIFRAANIRKVAPVIVFFFGCLFILRGMNLGIPYLSPRVEVTQKAIIHSCCHKK